MAWWDGSGRPGSPEGTWLQWVLEQRSARKGISSNQIPDWGWGRAYGPGLVTMAGLELPCSSCSSNGSGEGTGSYEWARVGGSDEVQQREGGLRKSKGRGQCRQEHKSAAMVGIR